MSVQLRLSSALRGQGNRPGSDVAPPSLWLREALSAEKTPLHATQLTGTVEADYLVVGGGFTGLWTALELAHQVPGARIRLAESGFCGSGASGANAGALMNLWAKFLSLQGLMSTEEALWHGHEAQRAVEEIRQFVTDRKADVGLQAAPWMWAASTPSQVGSWVDTLEALEAAGVSPLKEVSRDEARDLSGAEIHLGGVVDMSSAAVQPGLLAREIRRAVMQAGVTVYEKTPIRVLERDGSGVIAKSTTGQIRAQRVVLATNAWAGALEDIGRFMVLVASDTLITDPVPELLQSDKPIPLVQASDSRRRLNYYHIRPDGRIMLGKGGMAVGYGAGAASRMWGAPAMDELRYQLGRFFPRFADVDVAAAWRAPVEYSITSLPFAGWLSSIPGVAYVTGYSGIGVGPSKLMAKIVTSMLLDRNDEYSSSALARPPASYLPPEPFRFLGAQLTLRALARVERADDEGRDSSGALKRLASIDPTGFVG